MALTRTLTSQQFRFNVLRLLKWVPDSFMLRIQYFIKMKSWPNFKHPTRFTEKLQLYKMKYRNPVMHQCIDKYEVRKYVESKGLAHILNKLYKVYDKPEDIDLNVLPNQFVIKTTTGGGGQNIVIVKDKALCNLCELKKDFALWTGNNHLGALAGREWAYSQSKPRIIVECLLMDSSEKDDALTDYKFFCFNGQPYCVQIDTGRFGVHHQKFYDMEWKTLGVHCSYPEGEEIVKPEEFDGMKRIAAILSTDFPFVRVDLYYACKTIYFGELTFYPSSGFGKFHPDTFDFQLGSRFTAY